MYRCTECQSTFKDAGRQCPNCKVWGKVIAEHAGLIQGSRGVRRACDIPTEAKEKIPTGLDFFDRILCGGLPRGFSILISGGEGSGKSTLLCQLLSSFAYSQEVVPFYATAEEEDRDIALRLKRLQLTRERIDVIADPVGEQIFTELYKAKPLLSVIDSIQATVFKGYPLTSVQGMIELTMTAHRWAKESQSIVILVSQENKDGDPAGPRAIAHCVDCRIEIDDVGEGQRMITVKKNRQGRAPMAAQVHMGDLGLYDLASGH